MVAPKQSRVAVVELDLNAPQFQEDLFALERDDVIAVIAALRKLRHMEWASAHKSKGLHFEKIAQASTREHAVYSFRVTQKFRALAVRDGDFLRVSSLHADHDSAYGRR